MSRSASISIVVATLNEEETVGPVLEGLRGLTDDLLVVDGHSTDRTVQIARALGARVVLDNRRGKGDAVRVGIAEARHPILVFFDADGSHDPNDVPLLATPIAEARADLVIGSRRLGGSEELFGTPSEAIRLFGLVIISLLINYRFGVRLTDYQNGLRAIRRSVALALDLRSDLTTIEQEMAMKALARGYRVIEIPTRERRRAGGLSKVNVLRLAHVYLWSLIAGLCQRRQRVRSEETEDAPIG